MAHLIIVIKSEVSTCPIVIIFCPGSSFWGDCTIILCHICNVYDPLLLYGDTNCNENAFESIRRFKLDHSKNMIISHYNINSIRNKFVEISPLLADLDIDILVIAETKIDQSFPSAQFSVQNYKLYRQDRDDRGGGIMVYINDSVPHRLVKEYTGVYMGIDYMTIEISCQIV